MNSPFVAPHKGGPAAVHHGTNAALLIDFDNVTMGIRSDLTKELKQLLNSSIIKGKVAVQRAYADWRRYPQYIVPLSEGSVDLIFAPAYGSSKKNATDIRLAIDALELVFTRPEIGTFILLSGDSDFSSLVLKLKEYGKYVIGVGIKESSSDLLVQNCDEYYSYNALTGLTRAGEEDPGNRMDPWDLVQAAVERMAENDDVMRSDRLKQVMIEMDESFDEKAVGYSKYNRFLSEAATKGRIKLRKLENGQYEVAPAEGRRRSAPARSTGGVAGSVAGGSTAAPAIGGAATTGGALTLDAAYDLLRRAVRDLAGSAGGAVRDSDVKRRMLEIRPDWDETAVGFSKFSHFLRQAHNSEIIDLQRTGEGLYEVVLPSAPAEAVPDGDDDDEVRPAREARGARGESERESARGGNGRSRGGRGRGGRDRAEGEERESRPRGGRGRGRGREAAELTPSEPRLSGAEAAGSHPTMEERPAQPRTERPSRTREESPARPAAPKSEEPRVREQAPERTAPAAAAPAAAAPAAPAGLGRGRRGPRRGGPEGPPPLLPGQAMDVGPARAASSAPGPETAPRAPAAEPVSAKAAAPMPALDGVLDPKELGLPTEAGAVTRYLTNRYRGVGDKTAEQLVETFGAEHVFAALQAAPERVSELVGGHRAAALLDAWQQDYARRSGAESAEPTLDHDDDEPRYAATPGYERETPALLEERPAADVERETMPSGVERELPPAPDDREVHASDIERAAPDLWTRPREPQGE